MMLVQKLLKCYDFVPNNIKFVCLFYLSLLCISMQVNLNFKLLFYIKS